MDALLDKGNSRRAAEERRLEQLGDSVRRYEESRHPIDSPSKADLFRFLLGAREVTHAKLAKETHIPGSALREILRGDREADAREARALGNYFCLQPSFFRAEKRTVTVIYPQHHIFGPIAGPKKREAPKVRTVPIRMSRRFVGYYPQQTASRSPAETRLVGAFG